MVAKRKPAVNGFHLGDAERVVVGSLLRYPEYMAKAAAIEPRHFGNRDLAYIFDVAKKLHDEGFPPSAEFVAAQIRVDSPSFPVEAIAGTLDSATAVHFEEAVEKTIVDARARELILIAERLNADARDELLDQADIVEQAVDQLAEFNRTVTRKQVTLIEAPDLLGKTFPDPKWAIDELIPEGLTLLVGPPKLGKSWFVLQMALTVTSSGFAFGAFQTHPGEVLYYALEDTQRRLQNRLKKIRTRWPDMETRGLYFETTTRLLYDGFEGHLRSFLKQHPKVRLIIIDTLNKIRPSPPKNHDAYKTDYRDAGAIKAIADEFSVAIVAVHHTRKAKSDTDIFETISGTQGLLGAADEGLIMARDRGRADAVFHITGRDVEEREIAMSWDARNANWMMLGDASTVRLNKDMADVKALFEREPRTWELKELYAEFPDKTEAAVRKMLMKAVRNDIVKSPKRGTYTPLDTGTKGTREQEEQMEQEEQE